MPEQRPKDDKLLSNLGKNIARYIKKRGFGTAENFAWSVGLPKTTLSRIILGRNDVRISKLHFIAQKLGTTVDTLLKPVKK